MKLSEVLFASVLFLIPSMFFSCNNENSPNAPVGGTVLDQAKSGTVIKPVSPLSGISNASLTVVSVEDGVSNVELKAIVKNPLVKAIAQLQNQYCSMHGDTVSGNFGARATNEGIQLVVNGKNSTIVRFDDAVGTKYTSEVTNHTRTIISKSTTDDYAYGFMNIKVSKVEEKLNIGGSTVTVYFYANHKFGLVGFEIKFEDGSSLKTNL